jgi:hypothetical protein
MDSRDEDATRMHRRHTFADPAPSTIHQPVESFPGQLPLATCDAGSGGHDDAFIADDRP